MEYIIVSNNEKVLADFEDVIPVSDNCLVLLHKIRDLVHKGHKLISYPLGASLKMLHSPIKSVLISKQCEEIHLASIEIIENSLLKYEISLGKREFDYRNVEDYILLDYELLSSAIKEYGRLSL